MSPSRALSGLDHLKWLVERRADIQHTLVSLYEYVSGSGDVEDYVDDFIASAFSLWRAVFLAETDRDLDSISKGQKEFLAKVIADNAISYADDKSTRAWTVAYYLDNAKFRLDGPSQDLFGESPGLTYQHTSHGAASVTRDEWDRVHDYLRMLINRICDTDQHYASPISFHALQIHASVSLKTSRTDSHDYAHPRRASLHGTPDVQLSAVEARRSSDNFLRAFAP